MPANAGIQNILKILDRGFRRDDVKSKFRTSKEAASCLWAVSWDEMFQREAG